MRLTGILLFTVFSLLAALAPSLSAADNSITESPPSYLLEIPYLIVNYGFDWVDDIEWNKGQNPSALIFDPNGVDEPIRRRNMPFRSNGAYLDTSTGDIYVEDLFGAPGKTKVMNFNGTHLIDANP
ncbi:MAG: hypothetical protein P1U54_02370 [Immundisolibacteraceae bacterium]|nr:hypothetical protein [Immundisolibacteraceae bacterium]